MDSTWEDVFTQKKVTSSKNGERDVIFYYSTTETTPKSLKIYITGVRIGTATTHNFQI